MEPSEEAAMEVVDVKVDELSGMLSNMSLPSQISFGRSARGRTKKLGKG